MRNMNMTFYLYGISLLFVVLNLIKCGISVWFSRKLVYY